MRFNFFNTQSIYEKHEDILLFWQKRIFKSLFITLIALGIIPYVISCIYAISNDQWLRVLAYTIIYAWCLGIVFLKNTPFRLRVWAGLSGFYALGVFSFFSTGVIGSTRLYFLCFSIFAVVFAGLRGGLATLILNAGTFILLGYLYFSGFFDSNNIQGLLSPMQGFAIFGTFFFLSFALVLPLAVLIKAIESSQKEFKLLAKNSSDIIFTLNKDIKITYVNPSINSMLGFLQEEVTGNSIDMIFEQDSFNEFITTIEKNENFVYEGSLIHKNGTILVGEISCSKTKDDSGSVNVYQGVIRDITKRKTQEREKDELKKKLAQSEKMEAMGLLAGSVAHDLNNILAGIATYPEVLLMDDDLDPQVKQALNIIKNSGHKASDIVSDLLTISRGKGADFEVLNINSVVERYLGAAEFNKIKDAFHNVKIEVLTEPELLNIKGSYIHIEKTIMNLVLNAVEETADREDGKVWINTDNQFIDPSYSGHSDVEPGEYAVLSIIDNGSGISDENLKKVFEPFFTKKMMGKSGTGLGLTIVWNTVQDHKGHIRLTSSNKGTCFDLMFPATRQAISEKADPASLDEIKGNEEVILVVDDLPEQREIACNILENLGYISKAAENGLEAVQFIKQNKVDLVILDMIMEPYISGLETYQRIKEVNPDQKAIIASGYSESKDVMMAQDLGAGSFLKKPYTILDMGIAIKEELKQ
ncbi:MAG: response regulator [Desulfobacteraceae bacterium]|nr:response regulator [Desulfobacteraceae bacterium]